MADENLNLELKFTQADVDRIVQDRLSRDKTKYQEHDELKSVVEELTAFGYKGTAKEIKETIKQQREAFEKQEELEDLQQQAKQTGADPELIKMINDIKTELKELKGERDTRLNESETKQAEIEKKRQEDEYWDNQKKEFSTKHVDISLDELGKNAKFIKFIRGKNLPLVDLYEDFVELFGEIEADAISKMKSKDIRTTGSGGGSTPEGGNYNLSDRQKKLAKDNDMTFKEYANFLGMIKK